MSEKIENITMILDDIDKGVVLVSFGKERHHWLEFKIRKNYISQDLLKSLKGTNIVLYR